MLSRTVLSHVAHPSPSWRIAGAGSISSLCLSGRRHSSTTSTTAKRGPRTAKTTHKASHTSPPAPKTKAGSKKPVTKASTPEKEAALHAADPLPTTKSVADEAKVNPKDTLSQLEQVEQLERMIKLSEYMPTVDIWSQKIEDTLDVMIPHPVNYYSASRENYRRHQENFTNRMKNMSALSSMIELNAVPGVITGQETTMRGTLREKFAAFTTSSTRDSSILTPFRRIALDQYELLNKAVAGRRESEVKKLATGDYLDYALGLVRQNKRSGARIFWQLHRLIDPVKVVSLRATQGYFAETDPRFGHRLMIHALVKFHTEQSLEMYSERGEPLHTPSTVESHKDSKAEPWRVPAERRSVTEYLVLEKRGWLRDPFVFREQIYPTST